MLDSFTNLLAPPLFLAALGLALGLILALANRLFYVFEDPRIVEVLGLLPGVNCGACGSPSCNGFAVRLVKGQAAPAICTVGSRGELQEVADYLGVEAGSSVRRIARLACQGGSNVARQIAHYYGFASCAASDLVAGGGKGCAWGCLGLGDCAISCDFGAIEMNSEGLPVVNPDKCTACGDCVTACPKGLFSLENETQRLWVACKSLLAGDEAEAECRVACTGCGLCWADAPEAVEMVGNLAQVRGEAQAVQNEVAISRCPTGAIGLWGDSGEWLKGPKARKILRHHPLKIGSGDLA